MSALIETYDLKKDYQLGSLTIRILHGIDLVVGQGEYVALMGPSGSGKSTLMNILGCLDTLSEGQYLLDGIDVSGFSDNQLAEVRSSKIGFIFQSFNLLARESALENVALPMVYSQRQFKDRKARAAHALEEVGLGHRLHHKPNELSGGERQRVAIARSLVNDPKILLADEPTGNLDSKSGGQIMEIFRRLSRAGKTIIMVTHDPEVARRAERTVRLKDGLLVRGGKPRVKRGRS